MEIQEAIEKRRSIRRFQKRELSKEQIEEILRAGMWAPSAKNRQPWQFVVLSGKKKQEAVDMMRRGILQEKKTAEVLPESHQHIKGAMYTADIMQQAPVVMFVFDSQLDCRVQVGSVEEHFYEMANLQSIGAAIENMSLAALDMGLGSLWICDIYFAYRELTRWFGIKGRMVAALALGYPDERPEMRPRKRMDEIAVWMTDEKESSCDEVKNLTGCN